MRRLRAKPSRSGRPPCAGDHRARQQPGRPTGDAAVGGFANPRRGTSAVVAGEELGDLRDAPGRADDAGFLQRGDRAAHRGRTDRRLLDALLELEHEHGRVQGGPRARSRPHPGPRPAHVLVADRRGGCRSVSWRRRGCDYPTPGCSSAISCSRPLVDLLGEAAAARRQDRPGPPRHPAPQPHAPMIARREEPLVPTAGRRALRRRRLGVTAPAASASFRPHPGG